MSNPEVQDRTVFRHCCEASPTRWNAWPPCRCRTFESMPAGDGNDLTLTVYYGRD